MADVFTVTTDITRPADTTAYATTTPGDCYSDSTSAPTCFTLTAMGASSGGSGVITDIQITNSNPAATAMQGIIHIFDSSVTSANDNAQFAISDADAKKRVAEVPFLLRTGVNNSSASLPGLSIGYTCVGTADLRFLVEVTNTSTAYTPASAEVLSVRVKATRVS